VLPLASVAAMQGRIAMWHALGEAVAPLKLQTVPPNVFTDRSWPRSGSPGRWWDSGKVPGRTVMLPLRGQRPSQDGQPARRLREAVLRPASGLVIGGVIVAPKASELILPITMAIEHHLTVDQLAHTITIYPR